MLRITPCRNAASTVNYYKDALSKGDYYATGEDTVGKWFGNAAGRLGLKEDVSLKDFASLANNQKPDGSKLNPRNDKHRKTGYDFTFSAPKSVSIAYAVTNDQRIKKAFENAVTQTMQQMETENMRTQTGRGKEKQHIKTENWIYAGFTHKTARPVDGVPDVHLHRHCVVMNTTWNAAKNRFQAGEFGNLKKTAPYYEAAFFSRLANNMKQLGYGIDKRGYSFELTGIESPALSKFSRRTQEVEKAAKNSERPLSETAKAELGARTRSKKTKGLSWEQLRTIWKERLTDDELKNVAQARFASSKLALEKKGELLPIHALDRATQHLFERKSVVKEHMLKAEAIKRGLGDFLPEAVDTAMSQRKFYKQKGGNINYLTTDAALKAENKMLAFVREGKGKFKPLNLDYQPKADFLNQEQKNAIDHALKESTNSVTIISGGAGVGKTTLLKEIKQGIEEKGISLVSVAPSANASRGVLREEGFEKADTLALLLHDPKFQAEAKNGVILLDEAGLVDIKSMNALMRIAKTQNARILLSGDVNQHSAVNAGDSLRILEKEGGVKVARINEIQRQRNNPQFKKVVALAAKGEADAALYQLDKLGGVLEIDNKEHRTQALVQSYALAAKQNKSALVISPTHQEGKQVTAAIRNELKKMGKLDEKERSFVQLKSTNWTKENKTDIRHYYDASQELMLEFHQNSKGHKKGERWNIATDQSLNLNVLNATQQDDKAPSQIVLGQHSDRFTVFQKREIKLAKGDKIRITKGGKTREGTRLNNGMMFTVKGFTRQGHIKLNTGKTLDKDFGNIDYSYTTTSHSSQGATVDRVFIAQSSQSLPAASTEQFYVSISRAKERAVIFTDNKLELERAVTQSGKRLSAREVAYEKDSVENAIRAKRKQREKINHKAAEKRKANYQSNTKSL